MTTINTAQWEAATQAVREAESIVIVTHIGPDGDAFGSMLGMTNAFRLMGKPVTCAVDEGLDKTFAFLPGSDTVQSKLYAGEWDLMISTDASDEPRTGEVGAYARAHSKQVINLDHHATNTLFGDIHLVDSVAGSAAEVAYHWLVFMDAPITREIAMPLLTGLVTDTIGFRTSSTTTDTLSIAQALMSAGASLTEITERTLDNRSYLSISLWKHVLQSVELREGGVVSATITNQDFTQAGVYEPNDFGLVGFLIKITEAMIAVVFKDVEDGNVNISMRSKPGYDVSQVAFALGGGGHKQAAGATVAGSIEDVKKRVLPMLTEAARAGKLVIA